VCDHEVTETEWDAHYANYQAEAKRLADLIPKLDDSYELNGVKYHHKVWDNTSPEYKQHRDFVRKVSPEKEFIAKHGMIHVGYEEFLRD
jgi:hypothetical protein